VRYIFSIFFVLYATSTNAQNLGIELFGGVVNYQGDLRQEVYTFQGVRSGAGAGVSYALTDHFSVRAMIMSGTISADDKNNKDQRIVIRNLNFRTRISETGLQLTWHVFNRSTARINPYFMGGVSLFRFNPYTYDLAGTRHFLQPLGTEGQGLADYPDQKPYHLNQMSIPFGGGLSVRVNRSLILSWEIGIRKTFTDYIDDVSRNYADYDALLAGRGPVAVELAYRGAELPGGDPYPPGGSKRGNPNAMDLYYFSGIRATILLHAEKGAQPAGKSGRNNTACPKW
jgi:hypothetical protein